MALKRYKLTDKADWWYDQGKAFGFQIGYQVDGPGNTTIYRSQRKCPPIMVEDKNHVIGTTNQRAQDLLKTMSVPTKTVRNGESKPGGSLFTEITEGEPSVDIDLDEIFTEAEEGK